MRVIENEFEDKLYTREYPFFKYSLDFAWIEKKLCIEIDGEQHQRFQEYKDRDNEKDKQHEDDVRECGHARLNVYFVFSSEVHGASY
jgi:very-short-patch-repair endonuclease